jgi:hypothetical protein
VLAALAALTGVPATASAAVDVAGGTTTLTVRHTGVRLAGAGSAATFRHRVELPVTGGAIDPATAAGRIDHGGGLRFSAGRRQLTFSTLRLRVRTHGITASALVHGRRIRVLRLTGRARIARPGFGTDVRGLRARLTAPAARALDRTLHVAAFRTGTVVGTLSTAVIPEGMQLRAGGSTALALDPGALAALAAAGIAPTAVGPARLAGTTARFPIRGGAVGLGFAGGTIAHAGGLALTAGATTVRLAAFRVALGEHPQLLATVEGAPGELPLADLDLTRVVPRIKGRTFTLAGIGATLTAPAAAALDAALSTSALRAGMPLGSATVTATGR